MKLKIGEQHKIDTALCLLAPHGFIIVLPSFPASLTSASLPIFQET